MLEGLSRVAELVAGMKSFAHPDQKQKVLVDLNHALKSTLTIARNEYKYVADLETDLVEGQRADFDLRYGQWHPRRGPSANFDPLFTTKEVGRGTGQGLAIARSVVVDKHGGELTFETRSGEGTTVHVRLPIAEDARSSSVAA